jgi:murein DD-endopeptidase MepM/ murein hydrolase activator NlpD
MTKLSWLVAAWLLILHLPLAAQADCGAVDGIDYPVETLVRGYDDFALYRERFGGNHLGVDVAFDLWGSPVRAAMRGQVTYADPAAWNIQKGVVVISHRLPDGSYIYSVYGHMEETADIRFPTVGSCVQMGQVIGVVGWPASGRPHLHYEIRNRLPNEGGPGYTVGNPLSEGWFNPLDFTALWQTRLNPAFLGAVSFEYVATLPPTQLENGAYVTASGNVISVVERPGRVLWRVSTDGDIRHLAALPGNRVAAHTVTGQTLVLDAGRYVAIWNIPGVGDAPFLTLPDRLVFVMADNSLAAYDLAGTPLWSVAGNGSTEYLGLNNGQIALAQSTSNGVLWRTYTPDGALAGELTLPGLDLVTPRPDGSWLVVEGDRITRIANQKQTPVATVEAAGTVRAMVSDPNNNLYLFLEGSTQQLLALNADGSRRWQIAYPGRLGSPLLAVGQGCLLYSLDRNGGLFLLDTADGSTAATLQLYAGGRRNSSPNARLLQVDGAEQVYVAGGYLTLMLLDGNRLAERSAESCLPG